MFNGRDTEAGLNCDIVQYDALANRDNDRVVCHEQLDTWSVLIFIQAFENKEVDWREGKKFATGITRLGKYMVIDKKLNELKNVD